MIFVFLRENKAFTRNKRCLSMRMRRELSPVKDGATSSERVISSVILEFQDIDPPRRSVPISIRKLRR